MNLVNFGFITFNCFEKKTSDVFLLSVKYISTKSNLIFCFYLRSQMIQEKSNSLFTFILVSHFQKLFRFHDECKFQFPNFSGQRLQVNIEDWCRFG